MNKIIKILAIIAIVALLGFAGLKISQFVSENENNQMTEEIPQINLEDINTTDLESFTQEAIQEIPSMQTLVNEIKSDLAINKSLQTVATETREKIVNNTDLSEQLKTFKENNMEKIVNIIFATVMPLTMWAFQHEKITTEQVESKDEASQKEVESILHTILVHDIAGTDEQKALRSLFFTINSIE